MIPKKKKIIKIVAILAIAGLLIGGGTILYMFNIPHRNVQNVSTDFSLTASQLVTEFLENPTKANKKYLTDDSDSKILEIKGKVSKISEDFNGQNVVLLQDEADKAGVSYSFTQEINKNASMVQVG